MRMMNAAASGDVHVINQAENGSVTGQEKPVDGEERNKSPTAAQTSALVQEADFPLAKNGGKDSSASSGEVEDQNSTGLIAATALRAHGSVDELLNRLGEVKDQMNKFREYIRTQKDEDKPLYQWSKYSNYPSLTAAVSKLDKTVAKLKRTRLPQEHVSAGVSQATDMSASVSRATAYCLGVMNQKTAMYMEEMENSTMSEEAKAQANQLITEELKKLMEHSTRATERVWVATDLLRNSHHKCAHSTDWAWSVAGTIMTATIAAVVGIVTAHVYGPAGLDLVPMSGAGGVLYNQVLALVQRTQAVTNLTGKLYSIKLEDIDQRYNDLAAISESHGLRIDNLVDALGDTNEQGVYYLSTPKTTDEPCKDIESRLQKDLDGAARQMKRLHEEMELMRKNMNRMDIRLTSRLEKMRKE